MRFFKAGDLMRAMYWLVFRGSRLRQIYSRVSGLYDIVGSAFRSWRPRREWDRTVSRPVVEIPKGVWLVFRGWVRATVFLFLHKKFPVLPKR